MIKILYLKDGDDGSGGATTYFLLDGSLADGTNFYTRFLDRSRLCFGDSTDLQIYHNGTDSYIENYTGNFTIRQRKDDGDIAFESDDGSGGTTEYFRLDGGSTLNVFSQATTTNLSSEGTYFTGGSGGIRQLSITSGTNTSPHALHTFNIASSNGKYEFDVNGTTEFSLDSSNATFAGSVEMASGQITSDGSDAAGAYLELKHANNNSTDVCATINLTNNAGGYAAIVGGTELMLIIQDI